MYRRASPQPSIAVAMVFWLLPVLLFLPSAPAEGQCSLDLTCQVLACRAPASAVPGELWGTLRPVDTGQLPPQRDSTDWDEFSGPFSNLAPHWMSIDEETGWLFAALNFGLEIWDARGARASDPVLESSIGRSSFPIWQVPGSHESNPVRDADAPDGYDDLVAVAAVDDIGLTVFDTSAKGSPRAVYVDHEKNALAVYTAPIGNRHYAFAATSSDGLLAYDLTAVEGNATPCVEVTPSQQGCGAYLGRVGSRTDVRYVDGAGSLVALSSGNFGLGVEVWDVSNPANPQLKVSGLGSTIGIHGVTLWQRGGSTYLFVRQRTSTATQAQIYDVSCATSSCSGLGAPIWTANLGGGGSEYFTTHSVAAGGRDFLYLGSSDRCNQALQNEWLYDVSNPQSPNDVTPPPALVGGQLTGYWGWYYRRTPTGFNRVNPRSGVFAGAYFYRAAYSLFDIHEISTDEIFSDGFESGSVASWSGVVE